MKITESEVMQVAALARLQLNESTIAKMAEQIGQILEYVETLNRLDTKDVTATAHAISLNNAFREDSRKDPIKREKALANAPASEEGHFMVPKIL